MRQAQGNIIFLHRVASLLLRAMKWPFFLLFLCSVSCYAQQYVLPNESVVLSFQTTNHKKVVLAKDVANKYLVYRFGTSDKVEMEYPEKTKASFTKFKYSYYLRGGGVANEGMDLDYLYFYNNRFRYLIYKTYYARDAEYDTGVKVTDTISKKTVDIKGIYKTKKGTLSNFRDNGLVEIVDDFLE